MRTIVLDLEGTLVSNAVSQFPRPHLKEFIDFCLTSYDRVCLMTAVRSERAMQVLKLLADEGLISSAFLDKLEVVEWSGQYKDLRLVPKADLSETWIVDDQESYIQVSLRSAQQLGACKRVQPKPSR